MKRTLLALAAALLATQAAAQTQFPANSLWGNTGAATGLPTTVPVPGCTGGNVLTYTAGTGFSCVTGGGSGGAVSSVSNSDSTLTFSPTTGAVIGSLNLGHANTWTALQTFSTGMSSNGLTLSSITGSTQCLEVDSTGVVSGTGSACGSGSGAVNSVTNSDGTLTISPTTGAVVASLAPGHANTWTALQTFKPSLVVAGVTSGTVTITAQTAAGTPTLTLPNASGTVAVSASSPLTLNATTGALTCAGCATTTSGGALSAASPITLSGAGAIGINTATNIALGAASGDNATLSVTAGAFSINLGRANTWSAAQTFSGGASANGLTVSNVTGSTQCLHVNSSGVVSGAGADCPIYQEGTWAPTLVGSTTAGACTYAAQSGEYERVGRNVNVRFAFAITAGCGTNPAGNISISGLPFSSTSVTSTANGQCFLSYINGWTGQTGYTNVNGIINFSSTSITLLENASGKNSANVAATELSFTTLIFQGFCSYRST